MPATIPTDYRIPETREEWRGLAAETGAIFTPYEAAATWVLGPELPLISSSYFALSVPKLGLLLTSMMPTLTSISALEIFWQSTQASETGSAEWNGSSRRFASKTRRQHCQTKSHYPNGNHRQLVSRDTLPLGVSCTKTGCKFGRVFQNPIPRQFRVMTDGKLRNTTTNSIETVVKFREGVRWGYPPALVREEAALIVAWVKQYRETFTLVPGNQRILGSQDANEIYICFCEYDSDWVTYLNGHGHAGMMIMRRFGPWLIENPNDMRSVAEVILAIAFRPWTLNPRPVV
ncbi:hypothetical protein BDV29DRAFT_163437 [Aspergillus leporis]|uniref:Uncharacterized protein n=1 Tax=Aspergillus leporis TaxID=41062 RepID=A0A5N5WGD9_9EURO|nr:hypothetical protein BDV29DRAFT_163437 [Aspergillus leporis]